MPDLEDLRREYDRLDALLGIDTRGVELRFSGRGVRRLGSFRAPRPGVKAKPRITLASWLKEDEEQFWETARHEYAHAAVYFLRPGEVHGHDQLWMAVCKKIGCPPQRVTEAGEAQRRAMEQRAKYKVQCKGCGREGLYLRRGKVVDLLLQGRGRELRCTSCGGRDFRLYVRQEDQ